MELNRHDKNLPVQKGRKHRQGGLQAECYLRNLLVIYSLMLVLLTL